MKGVRAMDHKEVRENLISQHDNKNDIQICPECQKENKIHYNFCIQCGKPIKTNPVIRDYRS